MDLSSNKMKILYAILILAVAVLVILLLSANKDEGKQTSDQNVQYGTKVEANRGEYIEGFDKKLVLDANARVDSSFQVPYQNLSQKTAVFVSSQSVKEQYDAYIKYFTDNKYEVVNKKYTASLSSIYASSPDKKMDVNVVIERKDNQTVITLTQLNK